MIMGAQYRFSLSYALGLLTFAAGAIVIAMASVAMAGWIFGFGFFGLQFSNQSGNPGATALGMTPDAALCFILCGISLWMLRESTGREKNVAAEKPPAEKFLFEAALQRASLVKLSEEDSERQWEGDPDGIQDESEGESEDGIEEAKLEKRGLARRISRRMAQLCAAVVAAISVVALAGYAFGWDASVGGWLAQIGAALGHWSAHGGLTTRMAPSAAFAFLLNGIALTMLDVETRRGTRPAQHLGLIALLLSLVVALGHAYQISSQHWPFNAKAWPDMTALTAGVFAALSIGVVCARPRNGMVSLLTSESVGGYMARRMLPAAIILPAALGWLRLVGERAGYLEKSSGVSLLTLATILFFTVLIWRTAISLYHLDSERLTAETALYKAYYDLQKRIGEQTTELARANQDLWAEMIERERVEEDLWQSREELGELIENSPVGAHKLDPDGYILWANNAELDQLGYTRDEYIGHHIFEFHADESVAKEMLRRFSQGENLDNYEARLRSRDGSIRYALISSNGVWKDGALFHTRCFTRDVTESMRMEARLIESEEKAWSEVRRLDAIYESAPVGMALVDTGLRYVRANRKMGEMMAWIDGKSAPPSMDNILGRSVREALPALADLTESQFKHVLGAGEPLFNVELRAKTAGRSGEARDWLANYYPLKDSDGPVLGVNVMAMDVTESKRAESRLRENEARFRLMVDTAPVMIWMSGADKVCNYFNRGWLDYTGRTMEQELENGWAEGIHPDDFKRCLETYLQSFNLCREFEIEYRLRRNDGEYRWVFNHGAPYFNKDGTVAGYIGSTIDIHERKEVEEALRSSIESERDELLTREHAARGVAEDANRLKDEFLATVSHELRAPLNAIQGWVRLLRDGRLNPDEAARALETIERSTRAQNRIISDLLDVSRIVTGKLSLNVRSIQPTIAIESAVDSLRPSAEAKEISIELILDADTGPISGDSDRLRQIVWNLVSNAIKFTPKQGNVQVRLQKAGSNVEITVSDTGAGIAPDFLPFVFDRFRQGDGSSTRRQGGLGLGLAIVRHLTEMQGGSVRAESPGLGAGATFVVTLPLVTQAQARSQVKSQASEDIRKHTGVESAGIAGAVDSIGQARFNSAVMGRAPELGGLRVLAVDDDPDARDLIKTILTQCGAIVETASTIGQALAVFERPEEWQPELLISDIEMPEADGYQLISKLREIESQRERRVPAIALTACARVEDRLRSLSAGFQMHVTKPVEPAELLTIVASLTGRLNRLRNFFEIDDVARQEAG